jgi:hypothetical protein
MWKRLHVKYPLFLSGFNKIIIFSLHFRKSLKYQLLSKSVQWESSCFMRTDRRTYEQTDMTKLMVAIRNFANAPKTTLTDSFLRHIYIVNSIFYLASVFVLRRSTWPESLKIGRTADCLLTLRVRIPPGAWMGVLLECCVLSRRGSREGPITRPGVSYRLWCVIVCDSETSRMRRPWPALGCCSTQGIIVSKWRTWSLITELSFSVIHANLSIFFHLV